VAGAADVPVVVLLVRGCAGRGEVVVVLVLVLPSRSDGGDECRGGLVGWLLLLGGCGDVGSVDCGSSGCWVEGCCAWGAGVVECCVVWGVGFHGRGVG
jgi:hypothetical protein